MQTGKVYLDYLEKFDELLRKIVFNEPIKDSEFKKLSKKEEKEKEKDG